MIIKLRLDRSVLILIGVCKFSDPIRIIILRQVQVTFAFKLMTWDKIRNTAMKQNINVKQRFSFRLFILLLLPGLANAALFTEVAKLTPSNPIPAEDFGESMDVYGNRAIVGAHNYDQQKAYAYIYIRESITGKWLEHQKIDLPEIQPHSAPSVAIRGDTAFIGINEDGTNGRGVVYTFKRNPATKIWQQHMALKPQDASYFRFGDSVDVYGDTLVVTAFAYGAQDREFSTVYLFKENVRGQWQEQQKITLQETTSIWNDVKARIDRNVMVVSDFGGDGEFHWGIAYIYERNGSAGTWKRKKEISSLPAGNAHPTLGQEPIGVDRGTVVIGSVNHDEIYSLFSGNAYVYNKLNGNWGVTSKLKGSSAEPRDEFGTSIDIENSILVTGSNKGVYAFQRGSDGKWREKQKLLASNMQPGDEFGRNVSLSWNTLLVRHLAKDFTGSVIVYEKTGARR